MQTLIEQYFDLLWSFMIGLALLASIAATVIGARSHSRRDADAEMDSGPAPIEPVHEYAGGVAEAHGPVPVLVKLVIASVLLWTVVYVVLFAQAGYTFS